MLLLHVLQIIVQKPVCVWLVRGQSPAFHALFEALVLGICVWDASFLNLHDWTSVTCACLHWLWEPLLLNSLKLTFVSNSWHMDCRSSLWLAFQSWQQSASMVWEVKSGRLIKHRVLQTIRLTTSQQASPGGFISWFWCSVCNWQFQ